MQIVDLHEAETELSRLVDAAASGEEIVIAKAGKPLARLLPITRARVLRHFGGLRGQVWIGSNFDSPLPDDVNAASEDR